MLIKYFARPRRAIHFCLAVEEEEVDVETSDFPWAVDLVLVREVEGLHGRAIPRLMETDAVLSEAAFEPG